MRQTHCKNVSQTAYCVLAEQEGNQVCPRHNFALDSSDVTCLALLVLVQWFLESFTYKMGELELIWCQIAQYFIDISES